MNPQATVARVTFTCALADIAAELQKAQRECCGVLSRVWGVEYTCELIEVSATHATFELTAAMLVEHHVLKVTL